MPTPTIHINDLQPAYEKYRQAGWQWKQVGVFPTEPEGIWFDYFNYTVDFGHVEIRVSCTSIEGRSVNNDLAAGILNTIASAWHEGLVNYGDTLIVPLGIADENGEWTRDEDSIWWIGSQPRPARSLGCNMSDATWAVPVIWSSPLGWPE